MESENKQYNYSLACLKAIIIVLVLVYHVALYHSIYAPSYPSASMTPLPQLWKTYPVIDGQHSQIFTILVSYIDSFAMSLMFFLSGLFVWNSLKRKGRLRFIRDRLLRLGIPVILLILLIPLTYIPTYFETENYSGISGFFSEWLATKNYIITIHGWFICLLLIFNLLIFISYPLIIHKANLSKNKYIDGVMTRPTLYFLFLLIISSFVYIPMIFLFSDQHWLNFYLFSLQTRRIFLYLVFFMVGVFTGAYGVERTIFVSNSSLSKRYLLWIAVSIVAFILKWKINPESDIATLLIKGSDSIQLLTSGFIYVLCCVTCSLAFIALFLRFIKNKNKLSTSLDKNSYGIYIIHYPLISWIQYSLLGTSLSPHVKGPVVIFSTLILCWLFIATMRRIPQVAKII